MVDPPRAADAHDRDRAWRRAPGATSSNDSRIPTCGARAGSTRWRPSGARGAAGSRAVRAASIRIAARRSRCPRADAFGHCFACGYRRTWIGFVLERQGHSPEAQGAAVRDALAVLAERAGIPLAIRPSDRGGGPGPTTRRPRRCAQAEPRVGASARRRLPRVPRRARGAGGRASAASRSGSGPTRGPSAPSSARRACLLDSCGSTGSWPGTCRPIRSSSCTKMPRASPGSSVGSRAWGRSLS